MKRLAGVTHGPRLEDQRDSCGDGVQIRFEVGDGAALWYRIELQVVTILQRT